MVSDAELSAIGLARGETVKRMESLEDHTLKTVAVFSDSHAAIRQRAHLVLGPLQQLARRSNWSTRILLGHGIPIKIHWVPAHSSIPGKDEADRHVNLALVPSGSTAIERPYTSGRQVQQAPLLQPEAQDRDQETCSDDKHEVAVYQVVQTNVRACTNCSLPITVWPPSARQMLVVRWLSEDGGANAEHLFSHFSLWRVQQKTLWKSVGKATGWKAGRCKHIQISELFSIEECDQEVMEFLPATGVGTFQPTGMMVWRRGGGGPRSGEREKWVYIRSFCSFPFLSLCLV